MFQCKYVHIFIFKCGTFSCHHFHYKIHHFEVTFHKYPDNRCCKKWLKSDMFFNHIRMSIMKINIRILLNTNAQKSTLIKPKKCPKNMLLLCVTKIISSQAMKWITFLVLITMLSLKKRSDCRSNKIIAKKGDKGFLKLQLHFFNVCVWSLICRP